jgi:phosphate/sulfate permease
MRHAGLIQAGPRLDSGVVASQVTVTLVSRELVRAVVAASKSEMHKLSTANPKRDRNAYLCKLSREIWVTEKSCALLSWAHALSAATLRCFRHGRNRATSFRSGVLLPV